MTRCILIIVFVFILSACKKGVLPGVMINVENNTSFTLDSVKLVYDTSNYDYGEIFPGKNTEYIFFKSMPDGPAATADSAGKKILQDI